MFFVQSRKCQLERMHVKSMIKTKYCCCFLLFFVLLFFTSKFLQDASVFDSEYLQRQFLKFLNLTLSHNDFGYTLNADFKA